MKEKKPIFNDEQIENISRLGDVLRQIRRRLLVEGKIKIDKNGKTVFLGLENMPKK